MANQLQLHNRFIRKTFGRYLTDDVVKSLLESPEGLRLGGERRKITLVMTDLRGFTSMSGRLAPEQVVVDAQSLSGGPWSRSSRSTRARSMNSSAMRYSSSSGPRSSARTTRNGR